MDKKLRLYNQSLSEPFKEITEEDYYDLLDVLPPLRMRQNSFFVGEPYYGNMYSFCFTRQGRYFKGLRSVLTSQSELDSQIDRHMEIINRKAVISKEDTSKTISGTRLIPYYFSLDGKQPVFICNLVIQSDSRQARTDMANTLKSLRRNHYQFYKGKAGIPRRQARPGAQQGARRGSPHLRGRFPREGLGHPHERRAHDRAGHCSALRQVRKNFCPGQTPGQFSTIGKENGYDGNGTPSALCFLRHAVG